MMFCWFQGATLRQKLEAMAQLAALVDGLPVTLDGGNEGVNGVLNDRLCQYGILRPVGVVEGAGLEGEDIVLYQAQQRDEDGHSWWPM